MIDNIGTANMDDVEYKYTRVLVVEDNKIAQEVAKMNLQFLDCEVDIAGSATSALTLFGEKRYDLVLMDIDLPGRDGYGVTNDMRGMERDFCFMPVPIVGLSVHTGEKYRSLAFKAGMNDYLSKPLTADTCLKVLGEQVSASFFNKQLMIDEWQY